MDRVIILLVATVSLGKAFPGKRQDSPESFRHLLRRSATPAESDVTLIREERGLEDDFENDDFVTRKRRSDEDKFYQTLLTRAESRQQDKRSFDTDDVDNKAGFIVREDWTGDSKISDADRKELENLFESLSPDDPEKPKQEETRDAEKEPEGVKGYARDYTDWLMSQPPSQMTEALTHKVDVDHKLSKIFYRSSIPGQPCTDNSPKCACVKTCNPYPVVSFAPCHCSASMPKALNNKAAVKSAVNVAKVAPGKPLPKLPAVARAPVARMLPQKGTVRSVELPPLCADKSPDCLCRKACYPKPAATTSPCNCGPDASPPPPPPSPPPSPVAPQLAFKPQAALQKAANPAIQRALVNVNAALAKLCKQDSPQCLCARACYPQPIVSAHPCNCMQGGNGPSKPPAPPPQAPAGPPSPAIAPPGRGPAIPPPGDLNTVSFQGGVNPPGAPAPVAPLQPQATQNAEVEWCKRACHPRPVSKADPCNCGGPAGSPAPAPAPAPPPAPFMAPVQTPAALVAGNANAIAEHSCRRTCFPHPVASTNPCNCGPGSPPSPPPAPAPPPAPLAYAGRQPAPSMWMTAPAVPEAPRVPYYNPAWKASAGKTGAPVQQAPALYSRYGIQPQVNTRLPKSGVTGNVPDQMLKVDNKLLEEKPKGEILKDYLTEGSSSYQGCFKDRKPGRDLRRRFTRYDKMTPETCVAECKYQGYKFAGLQYSYLCFCGNAFGRYGRDPDSICNSHCVGDKRRFCGSFWHNSIYSVNDGKKYDPTEFDFQKVDAEEQRKDELARTPPKPPVIDTSKFPSKTSADVANHLMKAAEAALKAAKQLLPSAAKKKSLQKKGIVKREDNEAESLLEQEKLTSLASLRVARQLMEKQAFKDENKPAPKEKRSIEVEEDSFVDIDNGRDMLVAYLGSMEQYKRQIRGLDDDDDESGSGASDDIPDIPKFSYQRLNIDQKEANGEFVEKYDEPDLKEEDKERRSSEKERRSTEKERKSTDKKRKRSASSDDNEQLLPKSTDGSKAEATSTNSKPESKRRRALPENTLSEDNGAAKLKRGVPEISKISVEISGSYKEQSKGSEQKNKRSAPVESQIIPSKTTLESKAKREAKIDKGESRTSLKSSLKPEKKISVDKSAKTEEKRESIKKEDAIKRQTITKEDAIKRETVKKEDAIKRETITKEGAIKGEAVTKEDAIKRETVGNAIPSNKETDAEDIVIDGEASEADPVTKRSVVSRGKDQNARRKREEAQTKAKELKVKIVEPKTEALVKAPKELTYLKRKRSLETDEYHPIEFEKRSTSVTNNREGNMSPRETPNENKKTETDKYHSVEFEKRSTSNTNNRESNMSPRAMPNENKKRRRSLEASNLLAEIEEYDKMAHLKDFVEVKPNSRSRRSVPEPGHFVEVKPNSRSRRSVPEPGHFVEVKPNSRTRRSVPEPGDFVEVKPNSRSRRSVPEPGHFVEVKPSSRSRRSVPEPGHFVEVKPNSRSRRSVPEPEHFVEVKPNSRSRRSVPEPEHIVKVKPNTRSRRSVPESGHYVEVKPNRLSRRSLPEPVEQTEDGMIIVRPSHTLNKRSLENTKSNKYYVKPEKRHHIPAPIHEVDDTDVDKRGLEKDDHKRSTDVTNDRHKRDMPDVEDQEPDGVKKMAARADKSLDVKATIEPAEEKRSLEKKSSEKESGSGGPSQEDYSGSGSGISDVLDDEKGNVRSLRGTDDADEGKGNTGNKTSPLTTEAKSRIHDHVSKGVENLLKLVVNLYREQATIKSFEDSVKTLKNDILSELKVPSEQKDAAMRELRDEIKKTAALKLEDLTTSIREEIKSYASNHEISSGKVSTAVDLIPDLPVNDKKLADTKREIRKRAADLDSVEDAFSESKIPDVLREHFKRNSDGEEFQGEKMLSRAHRDVANDSDFDEEFEKFMD